MPRTEQSVNRVPNAMKKKNRTVRKDGETSQSRGRSTLGSGKNLANPIESKTVASSFEVTCCFHENYSQLTKYCINI